MVPLSIPNSSSTTAGIALYARRRHLCPRKPSDLASPPIKCNQTVGLVRGWTLLASFSMPSSSSARRVKVCWPSFKTPIAWKRRGVEADARPDRASNSTAVIPFPLPQHACHCVPRIASERIMLGVHGWQCPRNGHVQQPAKWACKVVIEINAHPHYLKQDTFQV